MIKALCNPPGIIKNLFGEFIWNSGADKILLTFDDGPIPETTEIILKTLNANNIKAVFFCVGNNINKNPSLAENILSEGHIIGNHTFNHKKLTKISKEVAEKEIESFNLLAEEKLGIKVKYFRPPHGRFYPGLAGKLADKKMQNVMWSLLTYDYKADFDLYRKIVNKYLAGNSIVVLHDSLKAKAIIPDTINFILETAAKRDLRIGEPSECLK